MNGFNLSDIIDAKLGATTLGSIYLGSIKLWPTVPPHDYSRDYLTIESLADNNTIKWGTTSSLLTKEIYWSTDGTTWTPAVSATTAVSLATLNTGEKMYIKAENVSYATSQSDYNNFDAIGNFKIYGNIESLRSGDNFINLSPSDITMVNNAYQGLFRSAYLVDASHLILPATTLATDCYNDMFNGCTSLIAAPALTATTLGEACYKRMFKGCTSLTTAPLLPAQTLLRQCYASMFEDCSSLNSITMLAETNTNAALQYWVRRVSSTGTFTKKESFSLQSGVNGIPIGWTVVNI